MHILQIIILALIQGACELLPVSSSAHVIITEKLMGLDPSSPDMTMLLVMLHTGTMFAVIVYFWSSWRQAYFASRELFGIFVWNTAFATAFTVAVGLGLKIVIEKLFMQGVAHAEIESLFSNLPLIAAALAAVGILIIAAGILQNPVGRKTDLTIRESSLIGIVQGICLPFRGFSRSGATISTGLLLGISKQKLEEFSFALAVVLTPAVIGKEVFRLLKAHSFSSLGGLAHIFWPSLLGMVFSFISGLLALKWLSRWLETGRWHFFGIYCLLASSVVFVLHLKGF